MKIAIATIMLAALVPMAIAQEKVSADAYPCIADMATGFEYENGRWKSTHFDVSAQKYILRRSKESDSTDAPWLWAEFGKDSFVPCDSDPIGFGYMDCDGRSTDIRFNVHSLKYQLYFFGSYVTNISKDGPGDTPYIEIGKCSAL